ncbi:MAG TPA: XdhC/CoxI family protein [Bacteroidota bacterium]|nr:XdhC/CoxI family protein [Bacteroidota bacterium]
MKELADIVRAFKTASESGLSTALATVVHVSGSTYRRPGARMLFSTKGRLAGLINAACLESDLFERAKKVIAGGKPELINYDTTSADDIIFGLGLGCNGTVEILLEPGQQRLADKMAILERSLSGSGPIILATIVGGDANQIGAFLASDGSKRIANTGADSMLAAALEKTCVLTDGAAFAEKEIPYEGGSVRVFIETLFPPLPLVIFGAGPDALPLVDAAKFLGWHVSVVDSRPAYATKAHVANADAVILAEPERVRECVNLSRRHVAVIMTHNFDKDKKLLQILLESPCQYVGLLGPTSKFQTLVENLEREGFTLNKEQRGRLHAPIGLDIGAETPEEIAFSIISEIKAVLEHRAGGFLRDRTGPIH